MEHIHRENPSRKGAGSDQTCHDGVGQENFEVE